MKIILTGGRGLVVTHLIDKIKEEDFDLIGKSHEILMSFAVNNKLVQSKH